MCPAFWHLLLYFFLQVISLFWWNFPLYSFRFCPFCQTFLTSLPFFYPSHPLLKHPNLNKSICLLFSSSPTAELCLKKALNQVCWTHQNLYGSVWGGLRKSTMASVCSSVWEGAVPQLLPWCQTFQLHPTCHWCLSSCSPRSGAQREWVKVSLCAVWGPSRGEAWGSRSFFHQLNPCLFLQPEFMGTYLPGTGTMGWVLCCGGSISCSWDIYFISTTHGFRTSQFRIFASLSLLPVWMTMFSLIP